MSTYLPDGFEELKATKAYWKPAQMREGENRLRIVMKPIAGWIDWKEKKPYRYKPNEKPSRSFDDTNPMKAFWSCYVWDYAREGLYILEINQNSILKALTAIGKDPDWGDFTTFDIKIIKEGNGKDSKYQLTPLPAKPLQEKIKSALENNPVCLEALYAGGDPWSDFQYASKTVPSVEASPLESLKLKLLDADVGIDYVDTYIQELAANKKCTVDQIIESALLPSMFDRFKNAYVKAMLAQQAA